MIAEDYVSFETAKLLKENGFNEVCFKYALNGDIYNIGDFVICHKDDVEVGIPTLQMAMKWLREVHKLSIELYYDEVLTWVVDIKHIGKHTDIKEFEGVRSQSYNSYEEACEVAIKYCLENLI